MNILQKIGTPQSKVEPQHVDEWLDTPSFPSDEGESYAKFVLMYKRMPAWCQGAFAPWMAKHKLFCTYEGKRYRCTGASRMGDVWLAEDFNRENGYDLRVDVGKCSEWGATPVSQPTPHGTNQPTDDARDAARWRWIAENCAKATLDMSNLHRWYINSAPIANARGATFGDAIDQAMKEKP